MVVGLLHHVVHILGAVRDHAAIIRETVLARVVGDGVVVAGELRGLAGHQADPQHRRQQ